MARRNDDEEKQWIMERFYGEVLTQVHDVIAQVCYASKYGNGQLSSLIRLR